ncbi:unnamed protein product [Heligmosomoides polygyrus]|uniref:RUN domain-containing protein n=1 Tax=Heligmosomoides polygyrus TaxID=6339 RepID=A0A3P7XA77_HELPZ|nr:unnamed protein product [Heligmosomoides polygyrus]
MSPVSLRPDVRASRSQHGPFQNKLAKLVEKLSPEREVVDLEHETGRVLFNSMDSFFAYGLLSGDKVYWRFVREFLPKTQQQLLRAEWGDIDSRRLSIAWLKDAFNRGTLHFQMLSFKNNRKMIERFYHRNACMSNGGMLEAVTDMIMINTLSQSRARPGCNCGAAHYSYCNSTSKEKEKNGSFQAFLLLGYK